jgi:tetratricopeptide (TPR) repeat protein
MIRIYSASVIILLLVICGKTLSQPYVPYGARMNSGRIHYSERRYDKAAEQFEFAVAENPNSAEARIWLGMALSHDQIYFRAAAQFDTAFNIDSVAFSKMQSNEDFIFQARASFLAMTRENLNSIDTNDWKKALHYTELVLRIDPKSRQALTILAQLYVQLNQLDELKKRAQEVINQDAEDPLGLTMKGLYFFSRSDWDSSHYYYIEAAKLYQANETKAKSALASLLGFKDTLRINHSAARLVVARRDRNPDRLKNYIEDSLKAKSKLAAVARTADDLYLTNGELNTSFFRAGVASLQKGNNEKDTLIQKNYFNQAQNEFEQALSYNPTDLDAKHNLAFVYYRKGGPEADLRAMGLYEEIIKTSILRLTNPALSSELGDSLLKLIPDGMVEKKYVSIPIELAIKAENELARNGVEMMGLQWMYFPNLNRTKGSSAPIVKKDVFLSTLSPEAVENLYLLYGSSQANVATSLKQEGKKDESDSKYDEAIVSFKLVIALNPKNTDAIKSLGVVYREKGNEKEAFKMMMELEKLKKGK